MTGKAIAEHDQRVRRRTWQVFLIVIALVVVVTVLAILGPVRDLFDWLDARVNPADALALPHSL